MNHGMNNTSSYMQAHDDEHITDDQGMQTHNDEHITDNQGCNDGWTAGYQHNDASCKHYKKVCMTNHDIKTELWFDVYEVVSFTVTWSA